MNQSTARWVQSSFEKRKFVVNWILSVYHQAPYISAETAEIYLDSGLTKNQFEAADKLEVHNVWQKSIYVAIKISDEWRRRQAGITSCRLCMENH